MPGKKRPMDSAPITPSAELPAESSAKPSAEPTDEPVASAPAKKIRTAKSKGPTAEEIEKSKNAKHKGFLAVRFSDLIPPPQPRCIREVNQAHLKKLVEEFKDIDANTSTIQLIGNVRCDQQCSLKDITDLLRNNTLKVEVVDGNHRYTAVKQLIESKIGNWSDNTLIEVIIYCDLSIKEARYLSALGNKQSGIYRSSTVYEQLKMYRRLTFEHFDETDFSKTMEVDLVDAAKINKEFLAENPQLKYDQIKSLFKAFNWMAGKAPKDVWDVVEQFIELAEAKIIKRIPVKREDKTADAPTLVETLKSSAHSDFGQLKMILERIIEKKDFSCHKELEEIKKKAESQKTPQEKTAVVDCDKEEADQAKHNADLAADIQRLESQLDAEKRKSALLLLVHEQSKLNDPSLHLFVTAEGELLFGGDRVDGDVDDIKVQSCGTFSKKKKTYSVSTQVRTFLRNDLYDLGKARIVKRKLDLVIRLQDLLAVAFPDLE